MTLDHYNIRVFINKNAQIYVLRPLEFHHRKDFMHEQDLQASYKETNFSVY